MAASVVTADPVLVRLRKALNEVYGARLERAVLYGSRARGDARLLRIRLVSRYRS